MNWNQGPPPSEPSSPRVALARDDWSLVCGPIDLLFQVEIVKSNGYGMVWDGMGMDESSNAKGEA